MTDQKPFASTAEIWRWLLERPEVNQARCGLTGKLVFLTKDGSLNDCRYFYVPSEWSRHIQEKKVTITREVLESAWSVVADECYSTNKTKNSHAFKFLCQELGL